LCLLNKKVQSSHKEFLKHVIYFLSFSIYIKMSWNHTAFVGLL